ncbi:6683_t:CDS:1, partial [Dentiscutata heterogama]
ITSVLRQLFRNILPSWEDLAPLKLSKLSKLPALEEEPELEEKRKSDYETTIAYQNTEIR